MNTIARPLNFGTSPTGLVPFGSIQPYHIATSGPLGKFNSPNSKTSVLHQLGFTGQGLTGLVAKNFAPELYFESTPKIEPTISFSRPISAIANGKTESIERPPVQNAAIASTRTNGSLLGSINGAELARAALVLGSVSLLPGCVEGAELIQALFPLDLAPSIPLVLSLTSIYFLTVIRDSKISLNQLLWSVPTIAGLYLLMSHIIVADIKDYLDIILRFRAERSSEILTSMLWLTLIPLTIMSFLRTIQFIFEDDQVEPAKDFNISDIQFYEIADIDNLLHFNHPNVDVRKHIYKVARLRKDLIRKAFEADKKKVSGIFKQILDYTLDSKSEFLIDGIRLLEIISQTFPEHSDYEPMVQTFPLLGNVTLNKKLESLGYFLTMYYITGLSQLDSPIRIKFMIELGVRSVQLAESTDENDTGENYEIDEKPYGIFLELFTHSLDRSEQGEVLKALHQGKDGLNVLHTRVSNDFFNKDIDNPWGASGKANGEMANRFITETLRGAEAYFTVEKLKTLTAQQFKADFVHIKDRRFESHHEKWVLDLSASMASDFDLPFDLRVAMVKEFSNLSKSEHSSPAQKLLARETLIVLTGNSAILEDARELDLPRSTIAESAESRDAAAERARRAEAARVKK